MSRQARRLMRGRRLRLELIERRELLNAVGLPVHPAADAFALERKSRFQVIPGPGNGTK
jgi:hypothetical protein